MILDDILLSSHPFMSECEHSNLLLFYDKQLQDSIFIYQWLHLQFHPCLKSKCIPKIRGNELTTVKCVVLNADKCIVLIKVKCVVLNADKCMSSGNILAVSATDFVTESVWENDRSVLSVHRKHSGSVGSRLPGKAGAEPLCGNLHPQRGTGTPSQLHSQKRHRRPR